MIFHINRLTFKSGLSEEQRQTGLGLLRQAGEANPAVRSYVVGPDLGGSSNGAPCTCSRTSTGTGST